MTTPGKKIVKLQVNAKGSWRDVITFDVKDEAEVLHAATELFKWDTHARGLSLRVIIPGDTAPLLVCSPVEGEWKTWWRSRA